MTYEEQGRKGCPTCGGAIEEGVTHCPYCGENLLFTDNTPIGSDSTAMKPIGVGPRACAIIVVLMGVVLLLFFLLGEPPQ